MPGNREIFAAAMSQADSLRWDRQWAEAAGQYRRALAEFPADLGARRGLGFCYMQTRQWEAALVEYQHVLEQDAANVVALGKVAELYVILQQDKEAFRAYLALGDHYAETVQVARSEAAWQKAAQLSPDEPEPHERLARHFHEKRDLASAIKEHLDAARGYVQQGELEQARRHAEAALQANSGHEQAQKLLAYLEERLSGSLGTKRTIREELASYTVWAAPDVSEGGVPLWSGPLALLQESSTGKFSVPSAETLGMASPAARDAAGPEALNADHMGRTGNSMAKKGTPPAQAGGKGAGNAGRGGTNEQNGRKRMTAAQVASALRQAQAAQTEGRIAEAIDLCEQIISSGFDRPDARYFLGWLYQEQERWQEAIEQFGELLNDPDYALSCFYALGQCYRAMGDLTSAAQHFDEAVDRVNLDALTLEESDQLIQLCHEAAEAHRALGELDQTETVYNALLGFLRSRGWQDQIAEVEQMMAEGEMNGGMAEAAHQAEPPTVSFGQRGGSSPSQPNLAEPPTVMFNQPGEPPTISFGNGAGRGATPPPANDDWLSSPAPASAHQAQMSGAMQSLGALAGQAAPQPEMMPPGAQPNGAMASGPLASLAYGPAPTGAAVAGTANDPLKALLGAAGAGSGVLRGQSGALGPATSGIPPLPEPLRSQVVAAVREIEKYVAHGLLTAAIEECLRVIEMAPQYLDVHLMLGEIYVKQGKTEQAITKYAILIDTYLVQGRVDDAIATYRRILELEPNNLTYRVRLINLLASHGRTDELMRERMTAAESYLRMGYADKAINEYEQALQENPNHVPMRMNYALALMKAGRAGQAISEYQRVLQLDPRNATALVRWQIAVAMGVGASATPGTVGAMGTVANRVAALEVLGRLLKALRGDGQRYYEVVAREYAQAVESSPSNVDLRYGFGQIQQQAGRFTEAITSYQQAMSGPGMEVLSRYAVARCYLDLGGATNAMQAARELEEAAIAGQRSPIDANVWAARPREESEEHHAPDVEISLLLAKAYQQAGQLEKAQQIAQQVKQVLPAKGSVYTSSAPSGRAESGSLQEYAQLVKHYRANKQVEMAIDVLKKMCAMAPGDPAPHAELGDIYISWGLLDEGLSELRIEVELHLHAGESAQAAKVLQRIAAIYWDMNNREESLSAFRQVIQLVPDDMQARMEMVQYCLQAGRREEATQHQAMIARHYFASHETKEAVAALQQLIAMDKSNFEAYDLLGQTYSEVGEYEQAVRVYRNLAKVDPTNAIAFERMRQLQELQARRA
ncbi:MAG TPA: tetratricopeptide repeat protein [Ktedonobacterales bacterium]|nr:tetratricopeptide repeat protein [Ktedonobacterales bacterium]